MDVKTELVQEDLVCVPDLGYIEDGPFPHKVSRVHRSSRLLSTGHRYFHGQWEGSDRFHVCKRSFLPWLGVNRHSPDHPQTFWRNSMGRCYSGNPYLFLPPYRMEVNLPEDPDFSNYTLYLNNWGTEGIRRARPGNPIASLGQLLIELRDLPRVPVELFRRVDKLRAAGSEYLNIEFGWKPLIADIKKLHRANIIINSELAKIRRDNGNYLKRKRVVEKSTEYTDMGSGSLTVPWGDLTDPAIGGTLGLPDPLYISGYFGPNMYDVYPIASGATSFEATLQSDTYSWFVGRFRYYVPDLGDLQWTRRAISALYGSHQTPALLWSVLPWSWLIDWFSNVGTILSNLSQNSVDNETLDNAFVMASISETLHVKGTVEWDGWFTNYLSGAEDYHYAESVTTKLRDVATPYGFGIPYDSLSGSQRAILAALAISRGRFT